jgi:glycine/D-amino acid oxidase-like deaminating enzyme
MVRFLDRSIDLLDALHGESGQAFELNRRGYVFLTADSKEAERLRRHESPAAQFVEGEQAIRARFPFVTERAVAMLHVRRAGFMNAIMLGNWLLARALGRGVELVHDEVTELIVDGRRFASVQLASGTRIDARTFVLAAGPLLPAWTDRLGLRMPIANELHGKISFEDEAGVIPRDAPLMIWNDAVDLGARGTFPAGVHLRPRGPRSVLGIWTYHTRVEDPKFPPTFDHDYPDIVIRGLAAMMPGLRTYIGRSHEALVDGGYYCKTPDNRPLIGPTAIEGAYVLGALSGFGVMASQAAAELLAAHLLEQPLPHYARAFHPARFEDPAYQHILATLDPRSGQL